MWFRTTIYVSTCLSAKKLAISVRELFLSVAALRTGRTRRQPAGGEIRCPLQSHGLRVPQTLLKGFLRGLPGRSQLSQQHLPFRGQGPAPLPPVTADSIDRKTSLSNQRQG